MNTPRAILGTALALAALVIALVIAFAGSVLATDAHREALPVAGRKLHRRDAMSYGDPCAIMAGASHSM